MSYASGTSVPVERSKVELERTLRRYGADEIVMGWQKGVRAIVAFRMAGRPIRMEVPMPTRAEVERTPTGKRRSQGTIEGAIEQAERQRWRAFLLLVKARLEAVEMGVETLDEAFLPYVVLPGGATLGQRLIPELERALRGSELPPLLPPARE